MEYREEKVASENEVVVLGLQMKEMSAYLTQLTDQDETHRARIEALLKNLNDFREERIKNMCVLSSVGLHATPYRC